MMHRATASGDSAGWPFRADLLLIRVTWHRLIRSARSEHLQVSLKSQITVAERLAPNGPRFVAERRKPSGLSASFRAEPGGLRRSATAVRHNSGTGRLAPCRYFFNRLLRVPYYSRHRIGTSNEYNSFSVFVNPSISLLSLSWKNSFRSPP
jgi:hypothetical protein